MGTFYVSSVDGSDADSGADWANAKQTVTGALAIATDPTNIIYVDSAHNFTANAAIQWAPSASTMQAIISVNRGTGAHEAGAAESVGASTGAFTVGGTSASVMYIEGVTLTGGTTAGSGTDISLANGNENIFLSMRDCTIRNVNTNNSAQFQLGGASPTRRFFGCTFLAGNNSSSNPVFSATAGRNEFVGCTLTVGAANPTVLMAGLGGVTRFIDCDLSAFNGALIQANSGPLINGEYEFVNCKLHASSAAVTGTWNIGSRAFVQLVNSDSGDTHHVFSHYTRAGTITATTSIYADSGAEFDGAGIGWQIVTTADCSEYTPFVTPWLARWNDDTATPDFSLELIHDSATDLHDRNCWAEFEYLDNASFPLGTVLSTRNAAPFDGSAVDLTNSGQTWTGVGGFGTTNEQQIVASLTPAEKSVARARLWVAVASKTLYLDPQLRIAA